MTSFLCIAGSPRKDGNSAALLDAFCQGAARTDAQISTYYLDELNYRGCRNLFRCKTDLEHCGQTDDLTPLLEQILHADIVVLASPIYFTDISGQMKLCLDRWFSFFKPDYPTRSDKSRLPAGKQIVLLQTQGEPEANYRDIVDKYYHSFELLGFSKAHLVRVCGVREPTDISNHQDKLDQASSLAETLATSLSGPYQLKN